MLSLSLCGPSSLSLWPAPYGDDNLVRYWGFESACDGDTVLVVMLALILGCLSLVIFIMLVAMLLLDMVMVLAVRTGVGLHC